MENSVTSEVFFWIGTAMCLITFGCSVAWNFVNEKAKKVLNWVILGTSLACAACYMVYDLIK